MTTSDDAVAIALGYARDVLVGKLENCADIRQACQLFVQALGDTGGRYIMDANRANHVVRFAQALPHIKGKWARTIGKDARIRLEPWQVFILVAIFGFVDRTNGNRRYREAYLKIPRKNGKSTIAAAIGLYMLTADREPGAEVYSGAGTQKQAWEVFMPAKQMAKRSPGLLKRFGVTIKAESLVVDKDGGKFEPVIGDPGDGSSPHCAIIDEYHEHRTDGLYDTMRTGMGARDQPLLLVITTAGDNEGGVCYQYEQECRAILHGQVEDETRFVLMYGLDPDDDWQNLANLPKANPNYGVSVNAEFLEAQVRTAISTPRKQNTIKQKHFNIWTSGASGWMDMAGWDKCADPDLLEADFRDDDLYEGLDLASKVDVASHVRVYVRRGRDGQDHYYVFQTSYVPERAVLDTENGNRYYAGWVAQEAIVATAGEVTDFTAIQEDIMALHRYCTRSRKLGYDPYNATQMALNLMEDGAPVMEVPQTTRYLSEPMKWIDALILAGRIHHTGDPALRWMLSNVVTREDSNGNLFPRKQNRDQKIDAAVAMITAFAGVLAIEDDYVDVTGVQRFEKTHSRPSP